MIKITDGNAFILRVQGITRNGDYEAEVDLSQIDSMTANFVRRGRSTQESSFDSSGRLLISNEGTLDKGVYGVEMVGYYNGQPWRSYAKNVFEIVNANVDADDSDATMNDVPIYDVTIAVTLGGSGVTADFVDAMIAKHSDDETSHPYLIDKIEDAGKVDDVKVNNVSVVDENKNANIQVPTTVAELNDANNYATKNYVDAQMATAGHVDDVKVNGQSVVSNKEANINIPTTVAELEDADDYATNEGVEEALAAKQNTITEASVEYTEDGGSPDASVEFEDGVMTFQMKNMKMKFSELTTADKEELKGAKGDPGDSVIVGEGDLPLTQVLGQDATKAISQKGATDAISYLEKDIIGLPMSADDAEEKIRHQVSSAAVNANGNRYTILFQVEKGWYVEAQSSWGSGLNVAIFNTRNNAIVAASGSQQTFNSGYSTAAIAGSTTAAGWLAITTRKTDNSAITNAEIEEFIEVLSLSIYKDSGIIHDVEGIHNDIDRIDNAQERINEVIVYPLTVDDADEKIRHNTSTSTASATGKRYSILFQVQKGWKLTAQSSWELGITVAVYQTRNKALVAAGGSALQTITSNFTTEQVEAVISTAGWLRVATRKTVESAITNADIDAFLESLSLVLQKDFGIIHDVETLKAITGVSNSWLNGKTVAILGDSISTNGNTGDNANVPEIKIEAEDVGVELSAYISDQDVAGGLTIAGTTYTSADIGTEVTFTPTAEDVGKVVGKPLNQNANSLTTWWEILMDKFGFTPIPVCWSGASITSHEKGRNKFKGSHAWHPSQIRRCGIRTPGTMTRKAPDVIIIYRGTNDMTHLDSSDTAYAKLTPDFFDGIFSIPSDDALNSTSFGFKEGYALTIKKLREVYPKAIIILCTLNVFKRISASVWPVNNHTNTLPEFNNAIREVADAMGCGLIEFDKDGITFENLRPTYCDETGDPTHPNNAGHRKMAEKAAADLMNYLTKLS